VGGPVFRAHDDECVEVVGYVAILIPLQDRKGEKP
jgi:hypothetical protein